MNKQKRIEIYNEALNRWGIVNQVFMVMEECGELLNVLAKAHRGRASREEIITELADVAIMVEQMAHFYGQEQFEAEKDRKLERLEQRLKDALPEVEIQDEIELCMKQWKRLCELQRKDILSVITATNGSEVTATLFSGEVLQPGSWLMQKPDGTWFAMSNAWHKRLSKEGKIKKSPKSQNP